MLLEEEDLCKTEFGYHVLLEEEYLCCVQDAVCKVLPNFLKIYKSDGIDIPMPQKYFIFNSDNTQKLLVNSDNTQKLFIN